MEYNRYGRAVGAPTIGRGGGSGQSYFIEYEDPLRETRVFPHLPLPTISTQAAAPLPSGSFLRESFGRLDNDVFRTHLNDGRATLSPYGFRGPTGISIREPEHYREPIGMPLSNAMGFIEPRYVARRELIRTDLESEPFVRGGQHLPLPQLQRQVIGRKKNKTPSSTARRKGQVRRNNPSRQRDRKLASPKDSDATERSSSSGPSDDHSTSLPTDSETKQSLQFQPEKEVSQQELNKKINRELQLKFTETPETKGVAKENCKNPNNLERRGWCSLCNVDCVTKEVLHKFHAFGKKHQSMIRKLEEASRDRKKWVESAGWCSLCEVDCKTIQALNTEHTLTEKHQMMLGNQPNPQTKQCDHAPDIDSSVGKRKQQMRTEEEGSVSSPKRQKLSVPSTDCKICNKVFNSQVVLESHLAGRKHASQLKKLENSGDPVDVYSGQTKKPVRLDVEVSQNSELVISANNGAKVSGKDEETALEVKDDKKDGKDEETSLEVRDDQEVVMETEKDDRNDISEPIEVDTKDDQESVDRTENYDSKENSKPNEVDGKEDIALGSTTEDATSSVIA